MTYLGTRPILQDELQKYELHHRARIAIKPGITGMWQVSGRSDMTNADLMEKAGFSANIITRIKRDNYISLDTIEKICKTLDCGVDDILEFTTEIEQ